MNKQRRSIMLIVFKGDFKMWSLFKILSKPHKNKKEKLMAEIKHYNELSDTAIHLGDIEAYHALQDRIRTIYFEMLAASFLETFSLLVPHFLIIWLLSLKFKQINIFGMTLEVIIYYPLAIIAYFISKKIFKKFTTNPA